MNLRSSHSSGDAIGPTRHNVGSLRSRIHQVDRQAIMLIMATTTDSGALR